MKALTISQPYADLIADGKKYVENRGWRTRYRGWLAIHAGLGTQYLPKSKLAMRNTGCIVALANMCACASMEELRRVAAQSPQVLIGDYFSAQRLLDHEHTEGPICWVFKRIHKLDTPIDCKGKQGLWDPPDAIELQLLDIVGELEHLAV